LQKRTGQVDWELLRTALAVGRAGSLSGAARALALEHSTVYRRLAQAEAALGARLFERLATGYTPTDAGARVIEAAAKMEEAALSAERRVSGDDQRLVGVVRVATSELLGGYLMPALLAAIHRTHPDIELEVTVTNATVDLSRREADVALRATAELPDHLVGHLAARVEYALFAPPTLLPRGARTPLAIEALPLLGFDERLQNLPNARWVAEHSAHAPPKLRFDSILAMLRAAAAGLGVACVPIFAGALEPGVVQISPPLPRRSMPLWVAYHPELRGNARVRAVVEGLRTEGPKVLARLTATSRLRPHVRWA
jgi:DNA-binding transcriptional LysR family regulator